MLVTTQVAAKQTSTVFQDTRNMSCLCSGSRSPQAAAPRSRWVAVASWNFTRVEQINDMTGRLSFLWVPGRLAIGFAESRPLSYPPRACDQETVKLQGQVKSKEGELQEQAGQKHLNTVYMDVVPPNHPF